MEAESKKKQDRADGYGQLIDENDEDRLDGDEETKLIQPDDLDASSSAIPESARVRNQEDVVAKVEKELQNFLMAHLNSNKMNQVDAKMKSGINRRMTEAKQKLKEE